MGISTSNLGKVRYNVRGVYNTVDFYQADDIVNYGGAQYICIRNMEVKLYTWTRSRLGKNYQV